MSQRQRTVIGLVLAAVTTLVLVVVFLAPGFGPPGLLLGGALILVTWVVSRVAVPSVEIVAWGAALVLGMVTVVAWTVWVLADGTGSQDTAPWWAWALFAVYEAAVAVTVGGSIWHLVRHVRAIGRASPAERGRG